MKKGLSLLGRLGSRYYKDPDHHRTVWISWSFDPLDPYSFRIEIRISSQSDSGSGSGSFIMDRFTPVGLTGSVLGWSLSHRNQVVCPDLRFIITILDIDNLRHSYLCLYIMFCFPGLFSFSVSLSLFCLSPFLSLKWKIGSKSLIHNHNLRYAYLCVFVDFSFVFLHSVPPSVLSPYFFLFLFGVFLSHFLFISLKQVLCPNLRFIITLLDTHTFVCLLIILRFSFSLFYSSFFSVFLSL